MKKSIEQLRQKIKAWLIREQRLRRRKLQVVRLEDRRLPDASFGAMAGVLTLDGFTTDPMNGAPELTMDSGPDRLTFHLQNDVWDAADLAANPGFSLSDDRQTLTVSTAMTPVSGIEVLATNDQPLASISDGINGVQVADLTITSGGKVDLDSGFSDFDTISVSADNLTLHDSDGVEIAGLETTGAATISAVGDITDASGTTIKVDGQASFSASNITLGQDAGDDIHFGSLTFTSDGDVDIDEDDSMTVSGSNSANNVTLASTDDLIAGGAIHAAGDVSITAGTITGSIAVNAELSATDSVLLDAADEITIDANIASTIATLHADDDITIHADISATDLITISAGQDGSGSVIVNAAGSLAADNVGNTADIDINTGVVSGSATLDGNVTADDLVGITAVGSINGSGLTTAVGLVLDAGTGIGAADNIDTAVTSLQFNNTTGATNISNTGALTINGISSFGTGGGIVTAGSPLTVNADVVSGGDFTLEAAGDGLTNGAGDDLTINASVTHTGAAGIAKTITFRADDDILLTSGTFQFTNTNASDNLILAADSTAVPAPDNNNIGGISQGIASSLIAATITVTSADAVVLTASTNDADNLVARIVNVGQSFAFTDVDGFAIGAADVTTSGGFIALTANGLHNAITSLVGSNIDSTNGGSTAAGAAVRLSMDNLLLGGAITAGTGGLVTFRTINEATQGIQIGDGAVDDSATLGLSETELDNVTTGGGVVIGSATQTANITVVGAADQATGATITGGTFLVRTGEAGTITLNGDLSNDIATTLQTDGGNIVFSAPVHMTRSLTTTGDKITLQGPVILGSNNVQVLTGAGAGDVLFTSTVNADDAIDANQDRRLTVNAGMGAVQFRSAIGDIQALADVDVTADTMTFAGDVRVDRAGGDGMVELNGNVLLTNNIAFDLSGSDKHLTIVGTTNSAATKAYDLQIDTGASNVAFKAAIGSGIDEELGALTIKSAKDVDFQLMVEAASITQTAGTGVTTFNGGNISGNLNITTNKVAFASGSLVLASTAKVYAATSIIGGIDDGVADLSGTVITLSTGSGGIGTGATSLDLFAGTRLDASTTVVAADIFIDGIGDLNVGLVNAGTGTAALASTAAIIDARAGDGVGSENIIAASAALRATTGVGANDDIDLAVNNLAFANTTIGDVRITDLAGGVMLGIVDGQSTSSNLGGNVTLVANSPITFTVNTSASGHLTASALESATTNFDNITVNTGVTVESTDGDVLFEAGDRIVLNADSRVLALGISGNVTLDSGFGDTDNDGSMTLAGIIAANAAHGVVTLDANAEAGATQPGGAITGYALRLLGTAVAGTFDLQSASNNVDVLAAQTHGSIKYRDVDTLEIGTATTVGILTTDADVAICVMAGNLTVSQSMGVGTATVRLQTSAGSIGGGGKITATGLGLRSSGAGAGISLTSELSDVDVLAATTTGAFGFIDSDGFTIEGVTSSGCFDTAVTGLTAGSDLELCVTNGDISLNAAVNAGAGTVRLAAGSGSILQTAAGIITAVSLGARATGSVDLNAAVNSVATTFSVASTNSGVIEFRNGNGFSVGAVSSGTCFVGTTGVVTQAGAVDLQTTTEGITLLNAVTAGGVNRVAITAATSINGAATVMADTVELNATSGIGSTTSLELAATNISADTTVGNIDMDNVLSTVTTVTSLTTDSGSITFDQSGGGNVTFNTVDSNSGNVLLTGTNGINADTVAAGTAAAGDGNITLMTSGGSVNAGSVTAAADTVTISSAVSIEERADDNAADIVADRIQLIAVSGIGNTSQLEIDGATLASRTVSGDIRLRDTGDGITIGSVATIIETTSGLTITTGTANDHLTLLSAGFITVNSAVNNAGAGNVLLSADAPGSDISVNADVSSGTGHVTLMAADDVDLNAGIATMGSVLVDAGRNWSMSADAVIDAGGTVGGRAVTGELFLGRINATDVALTAGRSISDSNGTVLNVAAESLSMIAGELIGDRNNVNSTPGVNADAIDTRVNTVAAQSLNGIYVNETDDLVAGSVAEFTFGMVTFRSVNGLRTTNGDMLLNTGGNLILDQRVDAGPADVRIMTKGSVTQNSSGIITADELGIHQSSNSSGDIHLFSENEVNILAVKNDFDSGDIVFAGTDDLTIQSISSQTVGVLTFAATEGILARGGDVHIRADRDLTVLRTIASVNVVEDNSTASGESITLESVDGNIVVDAGTGIVLITTDEGPGSNAVTGDRISLLADSDHTYDGDLDADGILDSQDDDIDGDGVLNQVDPVVNAVTEGKVTFMGDVTLRTDGGVAKKFGPRPAVGEASTAFFVFTSDPLPLALDNSPTTWNGANAYINAFNVEIGVAGEENLTVDIDWQDPANETGVINDAATQLFTEGLGVSNAVSSERIQQLLVAHGGRLNTVGHMYTALDFTLFQSVQNITTIVVDLSVSQHYSFNVTGSFVEQSATTQAVAGRNIASTDNALTTPDQFENAIASFRIPTTIHAPPALFNIDATPRFDRLVSIIPPENNAGLSSHVVADFGGSAVSGSAFSTEVYFQIRRQFEKDGPAEIVVERITDSRLISSREAFEEFVRQNPELQDGAGYEIWLISETGDQKVERPVVEFEITGGQPGPASEEMPNTSEPPRLEDLPFEQPAEEKNPPVEESPQASNMLPPGQVVEACSESLDAEVVPDPESNSAAETGDDIETGDFSSKDDTGPVESARNVASGTIMSLAVSRFRTRQRESEADVRKYSRTARFIRRNS